MNQHHQPPPAVFPSLTPAERARFQHLQALEDAIAYRSARLAAPCPDCGPARCDDHATDTTLITAYRLTASALATQPPATWPTGTP
jgi:hypothetical protein